MSLSASTWAWKQQIKSSSAKLVLLCLADCHNDESGRCNPSIAYIAKATGLDRKTVPGAIAQLEVLGVFKAVKNFGSFTQYNLQTSPEIGAGIPSPKTGQVDETSPEIGAGQPSPKLGQVDEKPSPKLGQVPPDLPQKRATNHKHKRLKDKTLCPEHLRLAEWIWDKVQLATQATKKPNLDTWADDIRKLNLIDGRDMRVIAEVFLLAHNDAFWKPNILCPAKLREKFNTLFTKFEGARNATSQSGSNHQPGQPRLTPAQRTAAKREALRSQPSAVGVVGADGGGVRPPVGIAAG